MRHPTHKDCPTCAARERARIRWLIGPALRGLRFHADGQPCEACVKYCKAIDAATRHEPKRKRGAK